MTCLLVLVCKVHSLLAIFDPEPLGRLNKLAHLDCRAEGGGCSGQLTGGSTNYRQDWRGSCLHCLLHLQVQTYYYQN